MPKHPHKVRTPQPRSHQGASPDQRRSIPQTGTGKDDIQQLLTDLLPELVARSGTHHLRYTTYFLEKALESLETLDHDAHRDNRSMAQIQTVRPDEQPNQIIDIIKQDGCVVIEDILSHEELAQLQQDLHPHFSSIPDCEGDFYGHNTKRLGTLFTKSTVFQKMALIPSILEVMDAFLLPGCSAYQINLTQAISIGPKEAKQIMHQDDPMFPFLHPGQEVMINCMWAIDDFTEDNGATVVVPGSHRWPRRQSLNLNYEHLPPHMVTKGVMKKGSVLIYLGSLFHSGGANRTTTRKCGAVISYCLGWLRQAENSYLGYDRNDLQVMPEALQRLLGYFVHEPNLGSVNGMDPYEFHVRGNKHGAFTEFIPEAVKPLIREHLQHAKGKAA
ncbi:MAG: phytanoyl-CoA dioxygenase family protein [Nitrospira sp.]|nr:phytanoyl-CoA dioxygenase family protein [Nitrospira sp.]MCA9498854.1 phytanoyl-CoA dioxygenase family protein [Nitrospira sp.]